jgi:hypothetical protein
MNEKMEPSPSHACRGEQIPSIGPVSGHDRVADGRSKVRLNCFGVRFHEVQELPCIREPEVQPLTVNVDSIGFGDKLVVPTS